MIFYTKDAMSPSRCPRRPDHFFHRKILQLNTEKKLPSSVNNKFNNSLTASYNLFWKNISII